MQHRSEAVLGGAFMACAAWGLVSIVSPPVVHADTVAYLVNVTVRPGYHFANADEALRYGNNLCDRVSSGNPYAQVVADIKADLATDDEFQASYLISQAVNELCPVNIWQLRNSAAGYQSGS